jgi:hypothetical protein
MKRGILLPSFNPRSDLQLADGMSSNDLAGLAGMIRDISLVSNRQLAY